MTSKNSSSKMFGKEVRQLTWMAAVQAVVYLMIIPFRVLIAMSAMSFGNPTSAEKLNTLCRQIGFDQLENVLVVLVAGIICGLCVFSYVHSSVKVDLYHSLSLKREQLFLIKYAAGFATFAAPYAAASAPGVLEGALVRGFPVETDSGDGGVHAAAPAVFPVQLFRDDSGGHDDRKGCDKCLRGSCSVRVSSDLLGDLSGVCQHFSGYFDGAAGAF